MQRRFIIVAAAGILAWLIPVAQGTVIDSHYRITNYIPSQLEHSLTFDFDLQQLIITDIMHKYKPDFWYTHMEVTTIVDSYPTTFSVLWNITNDTGVAWTGYDFIWGGPLHAGSPAMIDPESIESSRLQTVYAEDFSVGLSGLPIVPDGDSLTIEFNLHTYPYLDIYTNMFFQRVIPEPTTIALLGLGALALLRNRRRVKE